MRAKINFFQHFFCSPTPERDGGFLSGTLLWSPIESTLYRFTVAAPALSRRKTRFESIGGLQLDGSHGRHPRPLAGIARLLGRRVAVGRHQQLPTEAFGSESDAHGARRGRRGIVRADYYGEST